MATKPKVHNVQATAEVQLTLRVKVGSTWGGDCDAEQIFRQAREEAIGMISNALAVGASIEVTDAMVAAYLKANDAYWKRTDELPGRADKWRTGTPTEATRESLIAALAAVGASVQPVQASPLPAGWKIDKCSDDEYTLANTEGDGALFGLNDPSVRVTVAAMFLRDLASSTPTKGGA